ncbi:MAG TPA: co-chaperone GroES [Patescibacteria group bacterium]|nr:co-chaperone GroES [Patescibacteria group bacterium]
MKKSNRNIKPLFDYVLIRPLKGEATTPSGIVLPDSAKEKPQIGEVIAVGPGAYNEQGKRIPMEVKEGDKVVYKKWGGTEFKPGIAHEELLLVEQKDIMAKVA